MRVLINSKLCRGCGLCESIAPEIFEIGEGMHAWVIMDPVPEKKRVRVDEAIKECPEEAITIIEEEE